MGSLNYINHKQQLEAIFARVAEIVREQSNLDAEVAKLTQLMHATANMLPDQERAEVVEKWVEMFQAQLTKETGLSDAVRKVFANVDFRERLTVAQVRDRLLTSGYDFSAYLSNPLSSVSATLVRLRDKDELVSDTVEGVTVYKKKVRRFPHPRIPNNAEKSDMRG